MKFKKLVDSFNHAIDGIINTVRTEKNMKIHLSFALGVLISCLCLDISKMECIVLIITITMVISAELINTAIESTIDMKTNYYHPLAKVAKNAAAGGVLVTAINAIVVGYLVFWDKLAKISYEGIKKLKSSSPYTIFIIIVIVCIVTIIAKAALGTGSPLKGGMPSGHSALSFSIATTIACLTEEPICIVLSYLMAVITAQSRVDSDVHSIQEVVIGAFLGMFITVLIFTIIKI
ncbi:diacylglycerol kinase (ATP) [Clostridium sp. DSM 8431]|uniref:diacylglycerol kinase n=1 Tax=Clostridium sp. DSM 8431 TaxID=1761781 RepID=UPI0008E1B602|nr:diacylglycerol kinase [Clostridium sp. DSM 8431]SFU48436.1 diacylglycerol kinase (ATP) [Clostridium sp. DSM 8431]